ncbi:MAG: glycosyltransferase family 2 protein [Tissierellia bacterium]|nr:glycosyltransferase family 2 protein [Tissierellia bacterium]
MVDISIIIPCRNEKGYIENCIESLLSQDADNIEYEVLVVDGDSDDGTKDILHKIVKSNDRIKYLCNKEKLVSNALNIGIMNASSPIVMRMDAHTVYDKFYVKKCLKVMRQTCADNVGGVWTPKGDGYISRAIAAAFKSPFAIGNAKSHNKNYEGWVDTVYLGCWKRSLFDKVGLFDEELVRNQDDEFNLRIIKSGGKIWQSPSIKCWYVPRNSLYSLWKQYFQYGFWKVRVIQKHKMFASYRHIIPALFVMSVLLGLIMSIIFPVIYPLYMFLMLSYLTFISVGSMQCAMKDGWTLLTLLPIVISIYHFSYGLGFLLGIWHFILLGKSGKEVPKTASELTR